MGMKRGELVKNRERYLKLAAAPCFTAIALVPVVGLVLSRWEGHHSDWPYGLSALTNVLAVAIICVLFVFVAWYERRAAARYGVRCPRCGKVFVGLVTRVLATGKCVHCGERMLDDVG